MNRFLISGNETKFGKNGQMMDGHLQQKKFPHLSEYKDGTDIILNKFGQKFKQKDMKNVWDFFSPERKELYMNTDFLCFTSGMAYIEKQNWGKTQKQ